MSIDRNDYIMYGWKLPYNIINDTDQKVDIYKLYEESNGDSSEFTLISDGMCGEYNVYGLCINNISGEYDGFNFIELDINILNAEKIKTSLQNLIGTNNFGEPKLFIFSHFS